MRSSWELDRDATFYAWSDRSLGNDALAAGRVDHVVEIAEEHVRAAHGESAQGSDHRQPEARPWRDAPSKARVARQRGETRVLQHGGALHHVEQPRCLEREIDIARRARAAGQSSSPPGDERCALRLQRPRASALERACTRPRRRAL